MEAIKAKLVLLRWATTVRDIRHHPVRLWHWSAKWAWFGTLFLGAAAMTAIGEYLIGIVLLFLSALSLTSKLWHVGSGAFLRWIGTISICIAFVVFSFITFDLEGDASPSHLPHAWQRLRAWSGHTKPSTSGVFTGKVEVELNPTVPRDAPIALTAEQTSSVNALVDRYNLNKHTLRPHLGLRAEFRLSADFQFPRVRVLMLR